MIDLLCKKMPMSCLLRGLLELCFLAERLDRLFESNAQEQYTRNLLFSTACDLFWHESIGDPTLADAILDRLVHNAHRIALKGKSKRKREYPALGGDVGTAATGG